MVVVLLVLVVLYLYCVNYVKGGLSIPMEKRTGRSRELVRIKNKQWNGMRCGRKSSHNRVCGDCVFPSGIRFTHRVAHIVEGLLRGRLEAGHSLK